MPTLTARETEVLTLIALHHTHAEIAAMCFMAPDTVKTHVRNICCKWDVPDGRSAIRKAMQLGIVEINCSF